MAPQGRPTVFELADEIKEYTRKIDNNIALIKAMAVSESTLENATDILKVMRDLQKEMRGWDEKA